MFCDTKVFCSARVAWWAAPTAHSASTADSATQYKRSVSDRDASRHPTHCHTTAQRSATQRDSSRLIATHRHLIAFKACSEETHIVVCPLLSVSVVVVLCVKRLSCVRPFPFCCCLFWQPVRSLGDKAIQRIIPRPSDFTETRQSRYAPSPHGRRCRAETTAQTRLPDR